jgi:hypothetical protein
MVRINEIKYRTYFYIQQSHLLWHGWQTRCSILMCCWCSPQLWTRIYHQWCSSWTTWANLLGQIV